MCQQTKLNLRIVCRNKAIIPFAWLKQRPDRLTLLRAHRDILKIRVGAGKPARRRNRLIKARMDTAGIRMNQLTDPIKIRGFQLRPHSIGQDSFNNWMLIAQGLQNLSISRIARLRLFNSR